MEASPNEKQIQEQIKELVKDKVPAEFIYSFIQDLIDGMASNKIYVTEFKVDFANDYQVEMKFVKRKPKGWDSSYIRDFLALASGALSQNRILMYSITLRHKKPLLVEIGEIPDKRTTAYSLEKPKADIEKQQLTMVG
jgi:hypothetical protein